MNKGTYKDITGQRFGRLVAIERIGMNDKGKSMWKLQCDCGNIIERPIDAITATHGVRSCGCLARELASKRMHKYNENNPPRGTHNLRHTRIYKIYIEMVGRCNNPNYTMYSDYGGRGIEVCSQWYDPNKTGKQRRREGNLEFQEFAKWSYEHGYYDQPKDTPHNDLLSIERKDPNGNYCPENCSWITMFEQAGNKRRTRRIYDGEEDLHVAEFERKYEPFTYPGMVNIRLRRGWNIDQIIHEAKNGERLKKSEDGYWRNIDTGEARLMRHYPQPDDMHHYDNEYWRTNHKEKKGDKNEQKD